MSIVKALGIAAAPPGAQRLKPLDAAAAPARPAALRGEAARPPSPARVIPPAARTPAPVSAPATAPPKTPVPAATDGTDEAKRLFTRQTLSAYAALLAGEDSVAAYRAVNASGQQGPAHDGPPTPPGSVLDISA